MALLNHLPHQVLPHHLDSLGPDKLTTDPILLLFLLLQIQLSPTSCHLHWRVGTLLLLVHVVVVEKLDLQVQVKGWGDQGTEVLKRQTKGQTDGCADHGYDVTLGCHQCRMDTKEQMVDSGQGNCGNPDDVYDEE
jgi:hypothetical protein